MHACVPGCVSMHMLQFHAFMIIAAVLPGIQECQEKEAEGVSIPQAPFQRQGLEAEGSRLLPRTRSQANRGALEVDAKLYLSQVNFVL